MACGPTVICERGCVSFSVGFSGKYSLNEAGAILEKRRRGERDAQAYMDECVCV
jgi:hypothetical protein